MKKIFLCLLCGIMLLGITGCGNNVSKDTESNNSSNNTIEETSIIGTWKGTLFADSSAGHTEYEETYTFNEDGTYIYSTTTYPEDRTSNYEFDGKQLTLCEFGNAKDMSITWTVEFNKDGYDLVWVNPEDEDYIFRGNRTE